MKESILSFIRYYLHNNESKFRVLYPDYSDESKEKRINRILELIPSLREEGYDLHFWIHEFADFHGTEIAFQAFELKCHD